MPKEMKSKFSFLVLDLFELSIIMKFDQIYIILRYTLNCIAGEFFSHYNT